MEGRIIGCSVKENNMMSLNISLDETSAFQDVFGSFPNADLLRRDCYETKFVEVILTNPNSEAFYD